MKLSKALLGAMLVGIAAQTTVTSSCTPKDKKNTVQPKTEAQADTTSEAPDQEPCPACGMG